MQQTITWYMVAGKLIIIPVLGHQNKGKSSFTGSGLSVLMSQCRNNNELARHRVLCDCLLQKASNIKEAVLMFNTDVCLHVTSNAPKETVRLYL